MLTELQTLERKGLIDVFYGDESGFSLVPVVPYGWQRADQPLARPSQYSPRLNVLAWLSEGGQLVSFTHPGSINSAFVIDGINSWVGSLSRETVLVLDNAPMHPVRRCGSKAFRAYLAGWQQQGLYVFMLPAYSPHLNKAECLWRKMKYEWLSTAAYVSYQALRAAIEDILARFGQQFTIQFAPKHCKINSV